MGVKIAALASRGKKIILEEDGQEIARARIFLITNDLHDRPFALLEDVFVQESFRGKGYGAKIVKAAMEEAKKEGCYKIVGTSRYARGEVHEFYKKLGFADYGKEFRMELGNK